MKSLLYHLREVKSGGWPVMKRKIKSLYRAPSIIDLWAIPFVILARLIRPWYLIRFGTIINERIGHFAADAGSHYARRVLASSRTIDLYWIPKEQSCNDFFDKLVRRNFTTSSLVRSLYRCNLLIPFGAIHHLPSTTSASRDLEGILEKSPSMLPFLPSEDLAAQEWLEKQGWQKGDAFACLSVRDSAYLNNSPLHSGYDWNYHNYRDSDIATYVKAAEWLADQGVWVLRMGKIMKKPIPTAHPRIIDYAFHPEKSDFLDIWLFAHCSLCISTGSGPDMISDIYRCPMLFVNYFPMRNLVSWSDVLHVPKHLMWRSNQQYLTWKEHLENSHYYTEQYDQAGIEINDLSPEEILLAVQEAWLSLQGDWVESEGNAVRQARFWEVLRSHPDFNLFHGWIHPRSRAGDYWLNQMGDAFLS